MPTVVVIPVKSFREGNERLANTLSPEARVELGRALAAHVAEAAEECGLVPLIVTADREVAEWAALAGFPSLPDPATGLNDAAFAGAEWATESGSRWIVMHSDLPLMRVDDVAAIASLEADVIAPSADGGTSAVASNALIPFRYGAGSFHRHLAMLHYPAVVARIGLLHDLDSPRDLRSAAAHPLGAWISDYIL